MPPIQRMIERTDMLLDRVPQLEEHFRKRAKEYSVDEDGNSRRWRTIKGVEVPILWPSGITDCPRKITYDFRGDEGIMDIKGEMLMYDGALHEETSYHWLKVMGYDMSGSGLRLRKVLSRKGKPIVAIHGKIDGIINDVPDPDNSDDKYPAIWECKGINTFVAGKKDPNEVLYPHYRDQVTLYMLMAKIPRTIFTVKNKNDSKLRMIEYVYSPNKAHQLVMHAIQMARLIKKKKLGPRAYDNPKAKPCTWCRHRKTCWGE